MRRVAIASICLLTLTLSAQQLPEASIIAKQVQEATKQRKSIQYVRELTGEFLLDGKPVTEVISSGRRYPATSAIGKQTVSLQNPGKARIDLQLGGGNLMVTDGEATWTYRPTTKLYTKIAAAQTPNGQGLVILGIDVGENRDIVEKFMATAPFGYPVIMGDEAGMTSAYSVNLFPTFVLIGADGKVAAHQFGFNESALNGILSMVGLSK